MERFHLIRCNTNTCAYYLGTIRQKKNWRPYFWTFLTLYVVKQAKPIWHTHAQVSRSGSRRSVIKKMKEVSALDTVLCVSLVRSFWGSKPTCLTMQFHQLSVQICHATAVLNQCSTELTNGHTFTHLFSLIKSNPLQIWFQMWKLRVKKPKN